MANRQAICQTRSIQIRVRPKTFSGYDLSSSLPQQLPYMALASLTVKFFKNIQWFLRPLVHDTRSFGNFRFALVYSYSFEGIFWNSWGNTFLPLLEASGSSCCNIFFWLKQHSDINVCWQLTQQLCCSLTLLQIQSNQCLSMPLHLVAVCTCS